MCDFKLLISWEITQSDISVTNFIYFLSGCTCTVLPCLKSGEGKRGFKSMTFESEGRVIKQTKID